jgi:hypothetical protein
LGWKWGRRRFLWQGEVGDVVAFFCEESDDSTDAHLLGTVWELLKGWVSVRNESAMEASRLSYQNLAHDTIGGCFNLNGRFIRFLAKEKA